MQENTPLSYSWSFFVFLVVQRQLDFSRSEGLGEAAKVVIMFELLEGGTDDYCGAAILCIRIIAGLEDLLHELDRRGFAQEQQQLQLQQQKQKQIATDQHQAQLQQQQANLTQLQQQEQVAKEQQQATADAVTAKAAAAADTASVQLQQQMRLDEEHKLHLEADEQASAAAAAAAATVQAQEFAAAEIAYTSATAATAERQRQQATAQQAQKHSQQQQLLEAPAAASEPADTQLLDQVQLQHAGTVDAVRITTEPLGEKFLDAQEEICIDDNSAAVEELVVSPPSDAPALASVTNAEAQQDGCKQIALTTEASTGLAADNAWINGDGALLRVAPSELHARQVSKRAKGNKLVPSSAAKSTERAAPVTRKLRQHNSEESTQSRPTRNKIQPITDNKPQGEATPTVHATDEEVDVSDVDQGEWGNGNNTDCDAQVDSSY